MTKIIAQTYTATTHYRAYMTAILACGCLLAAFLYAVNLYHVISRTVALQRLDGGRAALTGQIESLDSQYLKLASVAGMDSLSSYGLETTQVSAYIPRSAGTASAASLGTLAAGGHEF